MLRSEPSNLVDAVTAAAYVTHLRGRPCAPGTIGSWACRGHIARHGRGRYDIREIDAWTRRLMTNDLVTWLRVQLDEDERLARSAAASNDSAMSWPVQDPESSRPEFLWLAVMDSTSPETIPAAMAAHMSRWDPAAVAAQVAADRALIAAYEAAAREHPGEGRVWDSDSERDRQRTATLADALRIRAAVFADRPGYLEAWKP